MADIPKEPLAPDTGRRPEVLQSGISASIGRMIRENYKKIMAVCVVLAAPYVAHKAYNEVTQEYVSIAESGDMKAADVGLRTEELLPFLQKNPMNPDVEGFCREYSRQKFGYLKDHFLKDHPKSLPLRPPTDTRKIPPLLSMTRFAPHAGPGETRWLRELFGKWANPQSGVIDAQEAGDHLGHNANFFLGMAAMQDKDYKKAEICFTQALRSVPGDVQILCRLHECSVHTGTSAPAELTPELLREAYQSKENYIKSKEEYFSAARLAGLRPRDVTDVAKYYQLQEGLKDMKLYEDTSAMLQPRPPRPVAVQHPEQLSP